jgi:hypothetical protein
MMPAGCSSPKKTLEQTVKNLRPIAIFDSASGRFFILPSVLIDILVDPAQTEAFLGQIT